MTMSRSYLTKANKSKIKNWKAELKKRNIHVVLTSIRRPQGNLSKTVNKELVRLFRTYCNVNQSK